MSTWRVCYLYNKKKTKTNIFLLWFLHSTQSLGRLVLGQPLRRTATLSTRLSTLVVQVDNLGVRTCWSITFSCSSQVAAEHLMDSLCRPDPSTWLINSYYHQTIKHHALKQRLLSRQKPQGASKKTRHTINY